MIKNFLSKIRQFKKYAILAPIFMVFEVAAEVAIPFMMSALIDEGVEKGSVSTIGMYGGILIGLAVIALITGTLSGVTSAKAASGFAMNLRKDMFENLQRFSFSNIDRFSPASLITRLTTDVTNVQNAFQAVIRQSVRSVVMVIAAFSMVFSINPQLSIIYVFVLPLLAVGLFFVIKNVHPIFVHALKVYDKLNGVTQENLHAIRVVKSYVRQDTEIEKFEAISSDINTDFTQALRRVALTPTLIQICIYASIILISWLGAKMVVSDQLSTGQLMSFFTYTMQLTMSLMLMSMVFVMLVIARSSARRVIEILTETPEIQNPVSPVYSVKDGSIVFNNVGFSYVGDPEKLCLSGINLDIKSGSTVGIIGGTGSSKTSLVQLIPRLYDTTTGELTVGGVNVKDYDIKTLRDAVAVVLQKNTLFSGTIRENLLWGNESATEDEIIHACTLAQAHGFVSAFKDGYNTHIEQGGKNVSGGQRQRLCIARALLKKPKVLILDDSTSAVDTATEAKLRQAFKQELPNTTKLIIAQRISSVMDADMIIVLESGRISALGTHDELLSSSQIYRETFNTQTHGGGDFDEAS